MTEQFNFHRRTDLRRRISRCSRYARMAHNFAIRACLADIAASLAAIENGYGSDWFATEASTDTFNLEMQ